MNKRKEIKEKINIKERKLRKEKKNEGKEKKKESKKAEHLSYRCSRI